MATINIDNKYVYEHHGIKDNVRPTFYGIRETINDSELILWWMYKGRQGIKWPEKYVKYDLDWPTELINIVTICVLKSVVKLMLHLHP